MLLSDSLVGEAARARDLRHRVGIFVRAFALVLVAGAVIGCAAEENRGLSDRPARAAETPAPTRSESPAPKRANKRRATSRIGASAAKVAPATFARCDANITVRAATTTCQFAQNVFYGYWSAGGGAFEAYSPVSEQSYDVDCRAGSTIVCRAGDGAEIRFSDEAVELYDAVQAEAYASSHDLGPKAPRGQPDEDNPSSWDEDGEIDHGAAPPSEDDGYDDGDGVTEPGENIPYYDEGRGYRVQCADGTYSRSGGIQGACSHHGGVR